MVDPTNYDDEALYLEDDRAPAQPKVINVKEVFQAIEGRSPFRDAHMQICNSCSQPARAPNKGIMIYCQGCSLSFHKQCIGLRKTRDHVVTKVAPESFVLQCRFCVNHAKNKDPSGPSLDKCSVCRNAGASCAPFSQKKPAKEEERIRKQNDGVDPITPVNMKLVDNADNVLFRCTECHRGYHYEHLPPPAPDWVDEEGADVREERLAEYLIDGKCRDCLDMTAKIEALVAWRPATKDGVTKIDKGTTDVSYNYNDVAEDDKEYLVKWEEASYDHCEWRPGPWVVGVCHSRMRQSFFKKNGEAGVPPVFNKKDAFPEEYLYSDIIFMVRYKPNIKAHSKEEGLAYINDIEQVMVKFQGLSYDATVWDEPPPRDSGKRWSTFVSAYDEYLNGKHFKTDSQSAMRQRVKDFQASKKFEVISEQPAVLRRGKLMPYQMEGVNWLLLNYYKGKSVVLADEMGLGKTVQVIALLSTLVLETPRTWPFLVVVPNSTCPNWRREIKNWAPDLRVVSYHGGRVSQSMAYKYELFPDGKQTMHAHVVIMSYDSAQDDNTRRLFHNVRWSGLVVDEGQRLKNDQNLLYLALRAMRIGFRLLLTGTPLQNNKRELFNLLQFIDSSNNATELDKTYSTITAENLPELHKLIRPYFLRRTKAEVLKFLPPMAQIIVPVSMTVVQEKLCKSIMSKNPQLVRSIFSKEQVKAADRGSLNNILMQLRKCLCHPFVYSEAIEEKNVDVEQMHRNLIEASAKLLLLKIMLPKLKERGHRVLIFSQFLGQLDIIEDFLHIMGLSYQRLDGSISSLEKQKRIDEFNAPDSPLFAFLLSTRAGGVGINLATADTVIVLDPDFNPHQDIQAFSRAHRIGQKKKVLCFQLMTKDSVEEKIMQIGRSKMALDHALIETMDAEDDAGNDLESILRHGAEALFSEETGQNRIVYDDASVDKLLDRSQVENTRTDDEKSAESQFSFARVWANETGSLTDDIELTTSSSSTAAENGDGGPTNAAVLSVWDKIIREREAEAARLAEAQREVLGRGGRRRTKVEYKQPRYHDGDGYGDGDGDSIDGDRSGIGDGSPEKKRNKSKSRKARNADEDGEFAADDDGYSTGNDEDKGETGGGGSSGRRASRGPSTSARAAEQAANLQGTPRKNAKSATPKKMAAASPKKTPKAAKVPNTPKASKPFKTPAKASSSRKKLSSKAAASSTRKAVPKMAVTPSKVLSQKKEPVGEIYVNEDEDDDVEVDSEELEKHGAAASATKSSSRKTKTAKTPATAETVQLQPTTKTTKDPKLDPRDSPVCTTAVAHTKAKKSKPAGPPPGEPAAKKPCLSDQVQDDVARAFAPGGISSALSASSSSTVELVSSRPCAPQSKDKEDSDRESNSTSHADTNTTVTQTNKSQTRTSSQPASDTVHWQQVNIHPNGPKVWVVRGPAPSNRFSSKFPARDSAQAQAKSQSQSQSQSQSSLIPASHSNNSSCLAHPLPTSSSCFASGSSIISGNNALSAPAPEVKVPILRHPTAAFHHQLPSQRPQSAILLPQGQRQPHPSPRPAMHPAMNLAMCPAPSPVLLDKALPKDLAQELVLQQGQARQQNIHTQAMRSSSSY